jgi:hypothetical protein
MECPACKNKVGFVFGTCIRCGYNHLDNKYVRIEVDMEVLERYLPPYVLQSLIERHKQRQQY